MKYGQFCPVAKALEILGEKWSLLIVRELLMGSARFSELQRGLGLISPTILSRRLETLVEHGLIYRRRISGQRGYEYLPTESCRELAPVLASLGDWGMRWTQANLSDTDYDVGLLMLYLERSVDPGKLPGTETVLHFHFTDLDDPADWWIVVDGGTVDVCTVDPNRDVDVFFSTTVRTMIDVWMERRSYRQAIAAGDLSVTGPRALTRNVAAWMNNCPFTDAPLAEEILAGTAT